MKQFFISIYHFFFKKKTLSTIKKTESIEKVESSFDYVESTVETKPFAEPITEPKQFASQVSTPEIEVLEQPYRVVYQGSEYLKGFVDLASETEPVKRNRDKVLEVIEQNKELNPYFTTTMVYKWLNGTMPILSVRKCVYKLRSKEGKLKHYKGSISIAQDSDKKYKYYTLTND